MTKVLEAKFAKRIERFFKLRKIHIDAEKANELIDYLYSQFEKQGRFKGDETSFYVTPKFVINALSEFLKINPSSGVDLFRDYRSHRSTARYNRVDLEFKPLEPGSRGLIDLLGRKHKPQYKITKSDGASLTPRRVAKTKENTSSFDLSYSPLVLLPSSGIRARDRAVSLDGACYERDMESSDMALWRKKTPKKDSFFSPDRIRISPMLSDRSSLLYKKLDFSYDAVSKKDTIEIFEFSVTKKDILDRIGAKRPISQKRVMGDVSAFEVMKELGVIITEKQNGRNFHWAHRRGWSLKGDQSKENLDPMTAGSNFDTLFKIEAPLKKLLLDSESEVDEVFIKGEVQFAKDSGLPFKITYKLSWGTIGYIQVVIDPMSHRVPTVDEHEVAKSFFTMAVR